MKLAHLIIATLVLLASAAYAAEGNGDPFPFEAPSISSSTTEVKLSPLLNDNPFGYSSPAQLLKQGQLSELPITGSVREPEPANSLPPGAEDTPEQLAHDPAVHPSTMAAHAFSPPHG